MAQEVEEEAGYDFHPLSPGSIRLLELHPGGGNDALRGSVSVASLDSRPRYEAMSYLWGDKSNQQALYIGDTVIRITTSAAAALRRVRLETRTRTLWMDQVCINQADLTERSQQVRLMWKIYSEAQKVLMWLGDDTDGMAAEAKAFIAELEERWEEPIEAPHYGTDETLEHYKLPAESSSKWPAYRALMRLPYFSRVWMLQEVMLAGDAVAYWGDFEVPWLHIAHAASWGYESAGVIEWSGFAILGGTVKNSGVVLEDCEMVMNMLDNGNRTTHWMVGLLSDRQATDQRDKVFAILDMIQVEERPSFVADYMLTTVEVYKRMTEHIIFNTSYGLRELKNCTLTVKHPAHAGKRWPTWVPRWGDIKHSYILGVDPEHSLPCDGEPMQAFVEPGSDFLDVHGILFDSVTHIAKGLGGGDVQAIEASFPLVKQYANAGLHTEPLILQFLWTLLATEADLPELEQQTWLRDELAWSFVNYFLILLADGADSIRKPRQDMIEAVVLAKLGLLDVETNFDPRNAEHITLAAEWKAQLRRECDEHQEETFRSPDSHLWRQCEESNRLHFRAACKTPLTEAQLCEMVCYDVASLVHSKGDISGHKFQDAYLECGAHHELFVTSRGAMGMAPRQAEPGDVVVVLLGADVPYLLRPVQGGYWIVGSCYCYGLMHGEYVRKLKEEHRLTAETQIFRLL